MKMYVAVVVLVWFVFTIFWFKMKVDAGGFLEGIFAYIGISTAILMGGAVIGALVMTSPGLMLMGIICLVSCLFLFAGGNIVQFFNKTGTRTTIKKYEACKKYESVRQVSSEELLKELSGVQKGQVIRFGFYDWKVLDVQDGCALLFVEQMTGMDKIYDSWYNFGIFQYLRSTVDTSFGTGERSLIRDNTLFLLSQQEVELYLPQEQRVLKVGNKYIDWWLRDQSFDSETKKCVSTAVDGNSGKFKQLENKTVCGIRPAMWVKIK